MHGQHWELDSQAAGQRSAHRHSPSGLVNREIWAARHELDEFETSR